MTPVQTLRTAKRAAMVTLKGSGAHMSQTQKDGIDAYIAAIDEEATKDADGLMNVLDSVAENAPYGLRTAGESASSS